MRASASMRCEYNKWMMACELARTLGTLEPPLSTRPPLPGGFQALALVRAQATVSASAAASAATPRAGAGCEAEWLAEADYECESDEGNNLDLMHEVGGARGLLCGMRGKNWT